jgi:hypothetical protein
MTGRFRAGNESTQDCDVNVQAALLNDFLINRFLLPSRPKCLVNKEKPQNRNDISVF